MELGQAWTCRKEQKGQKAQYRRGVHGGILNAEGRRRENFFRFWPKKDRRRGFSFIFPGKQFFKKREKSRPAAKIRNGGLRDPAWFLSSAHACGAPGLQEGRGAYTAL